ncbi:hypothetical protein GCM10010174_01010 [Kutzneria viridogrisea]|uniref:Uncharacterized protein n=2 Tax=Kutzneria TaxID=43356 RepID=W5WI06_9PSEU|nr:hypothetical protein [Kutzneria albida]AHH97794.1 hypothetical protein KALB_4432 [Kutzneria albida DSM 43870]MBA8924619.1 hypothetical protein [Kutzneria viridogrisea]
MALRVTDIDAPREPLDRSDAYLKLSVDWRPGALGLEPLHYYLRDRAGATQGYVELKVSAHTGEVCALVLITEPRARTAMPPLDVPAKPGTVWVDVTAWMGFDQIDEVGDLAVAEGEGSTYYAFSRAQPVKWVVAGFVRFGVGLGEELVGVLVEQDRKGQHW